MSIQVYFFQNFEKKENSTKQPTLSTGTEFHCLLKEDTGVIEPEIEISLASNNPISYTYAYIPSWNRYYFVKNWEFTIGMRWRAYLKEDVLASYKTAIGSQTKYILRSYSNYDLDVKDSYYPSTSVLNQTILTDDNPFTLLTDIDNTAQPCGFYILGLIGNRPSGNVPNVGGVNYYLMTGNQMTEFVNYMMGDAFARIIEDTSAGLTEAVVKSIFNPIEYIASCMYIPFRLSYTNENVQPQLGWWITAPLTTPSKAIGSGNATALVKVPTTATPSFVIPDHPQYARGHYLNLEPYSSYDLHFEPWGDIHLNSALINQYKNISTSIEVDCISGMGRLTIIGNGTKILSTSIAQVGVPIQISQVMTDVMGAFNTSLATLGSVLTQKSIAGMITTALSGAVSTAESLFTPEPSSTGANGTILSYSGGVLSGGTETNGCYLKINRYNIVDENLVEFGRPCCKNLTINTLSGYTLCADSDNDIKAYDSEKSMIASYLTGGFYYE